jgi:hypothetical protein
MKTTILAAALLLAAAPASAAEYGVKAQLDAMGCTGAGIGAAFRGDFSAWVLPSFIGGNHMKDGQYIEAVTGADGVRRCVVRP